MADITDEEHPGNPTNTQRENPSDQFIPPKNSVYSDSITANQETENMEVHHHPNLHHKPKPWHEYFLEFLMIFLAVTLGFFAENLRERITESNREKAFAQELYIELKDDSAVATSKISLRLTKEKDLDFLNVYFRDSSLTVLPKSFYPAFVKGFYLFNTYTFEPKDGILTQLRNSGAILSFKNIELQKLLGNISVSINNVRYRNDQEYQFFANPLKPFLLEHFDFNWYDKLRKNDEDTSALTVVNRYLRSNIIYEGKILHVESIDRTEAYNMVVFFKQMLLSTRTLQLNNYINLNHAILELLRKNYSLESE